MIRSFRPTDVKTISPNFDDLPTMWRHCRYDRPSLLNERPTFLLPSPRGSCNRHLPLLSILLTSLLSRDSPVASCSYWRTTHPHQMLPFTQCRALSTLTAASAFFTLPFRPQVGRLRAPSIHSLSARSLDYCVLVKKLQAWLR